MNDPYLTRARELCNASVHYNCAQSVLGAFAGVCGLDEETAVRMGTHFGSGMKMGSVCGAITGALMVIGMLGGGQAEYSAFMKAMRENHDGMVNCRDLLRRNAQTHVPQKVHCDGLVYEAVENVEKVMRLETQT